MSTALVSVLLALLGASAGAQSQSVTSGGAKVLTGKAGRYYGEIGSAWIDLATGKITRGPYVKDRSVGNTTISFDNMDLSTSTPGMSASAPGSGATQWVDAATKGTYAGITAPNAIGSQMMDSFVFAYCSAEADTMSGGPGGTALIGFYPGYVSGGPLTLPLATYLLTGLPTGNAAPGSFTAGTYTCFTFTVVLPQLLCFADGPIGYSWDFLDVGTDGLGATWPMLSCVSTCGPIPPTDAQGMVNTIDEYSPPATFFATISPGTPLGFDSSISMQIIEPEVCVATISSCLGIPAAPDVLTSTPAIVGSSWTATVTSGFARTKTGLWTLYFGNAGVAKPTGVDIGQFPAGGGNFGTNKGGRKLLCNIDPSNPFGGCLSIPLPPGLGAQSPCTPGMVPKKITLLGVPWCGQAVVAGTVPAGMSGGGNARLTSSISGVVGNQ